MMIASRRFNIYLAPALALALTLMISTGCATSKPEDGAKKKHKRVEAALRLHLEINPDGTDRIGTATVGRSSPFTVSIEKNAFLNELLISKASLIETMGGFSIGLEFDQKGTWILEQYSTTNKGRRVAIWAEFGEIRWIAAPMFTQRLADGKMVFTPDVTREEAERIVDGLNLVAEKVREGRK